MPLSAVRQPGQLPGWESAGQGTQPCRGGGSHIAEPDAATPGVIPFQAENFRFQTLSNTIDQQTRKNIPWNTENKVFIALVAGVVFRGSCLDLIRYAARACSLQECHIN